LPFSITREVLDNKEIKYFDLIQEPGETLFVPSKWFHQVNNLDDAVSINHNWFNSCNALSISKSLLDHQDDVVREISDCKDMENFAEHCQLMLKASFGMNVTDFVEILAHIANKRIKLIKDGTNFKLFEDFTVGANLVTFDLDVILEVFKTLKLNELVQQFDDIVSEICDCEDRINKVLVGSK
jgi:JmjC domain, hydroxylase